MWYYEPSYEDDDEDNNGDDGSTEEADEAAMQDYDAEYKRKYLTLNRCVLDLIRNCPNLRSYA
jgi:hypothetical protein